MMTKRMNLNLEDLDQVTGAIVNLARKNGKTLQDLLDDPLVADETKERIKYYWDKVITK